VLTPLGNSAILARSRRKLKVEEGDWGDSFQVGAAKVTLTPARHWSKRGPRDRNMALWCAFLIETPAGPLYFAADTGYGMGDHFRDIAKRAGPVRLALLPIGAYQPRWFMRAQHMNPEEAVRAHIDLGAEASVAIHHGTVQLTDEGIGEPVAMLHASLRAYGVPQERFRALDPGESWRIPRLPVRRPLAMAGEGR
jgi:L-ascorbate metabolism protein UlaG (beta-lactamase superfamily)